MTNIATYDPTNIAHVLGEGADWSHDTPEVVFARWPDGSTAHLKREAGGKWHFMQDTAERRYLSQCDYVAGERE